MVNRCLLSSQVQFSTPALFKFWFLRKCGTDLEMRINLVKGSRSSSPRTCWIWLIIFWYDLSLASFWWWPPCLLCSLIIRIGSGFWFSLFLLCVSSMWLLHNFGVKQKSFSSDLWLQLETFLKPWQDQTPPFKCQVNRKNLHVRCLEEWFQKIVWLISWLEMVLVQTLQSSWLWRFATLCEDVQEDNSYDLQVQIGATAISVITYQGPKDARSALILVVGNRSDSWALNGLLLCGSVFSILP